MKRLSVPNRKKIDELIVRYTLEPGLRDVYVEGPAEKNLLEWFFTESRLEQIDIFDVNTINIPESVTNNYGLRSDNNQCGNRDRIITLSLEFDKKLKNHIPYLICIADSDFDFLLGRKFHSSYLVYSEYTSTDLCFFSEQSLGKILTLLGSNPVCGIKQWVQNIKDVLQKLFLIRTANVKLAWDMTWQEFSKCCYIDNNDYVIFKDQEFINKYLNANGRRNNIDTFISVLNELTQIQVASYECVIRGHDLFELLGWYITRKKGKHGNKFRDQEVIRNSIIASANLESIKDKDPFKSLIHIYMQP